MMKILVCLKQVPDTESKIKIAVDAKQIDTQEIKWITSPYDEYAIEEALRIKERMTATVTTISVGEDRAKDMLRNSLALGADEAVLLKTSGPQDDPLGVAAVLVDFIKENAFDLILLGNKGSGGDHASVGPMLAGLLGLPHANVVIKLEIEENRFLAHRQIESGIEVVEGTLPAVITTQKGLNEPRYANLKGIMAAKKKEITEKECSSPVSATQWEQLTLPPPRLEGRRLEGTPQEQARLLIQALQNEAKIF